MTNIEDIVKEHNRIARREYYLFNKERYKLTGK